MFETSVPIAVPETEAPDPRRQLDDLVAGARRGERWAWDALVERYRPLVRAVASGYRLNGRDVEDVDQTVWLRLVENLDRIREPRALPKWLITTAGNECRRLTRTRQRTLLVGVLDEPVQENGAEPPGAPETDLLRRELTRTVQQGLAELPVAQQQVLRLIASERQLISSRPVDEDLLGGFGLRGFVGSFDELAVDEHRAGADERDQVWGVDRAPAVLGGLDQLERHRQPGRA